MSNRKGAFVPQKRLPAGRRCVGVREEGGPQEVPNITPIRFREFVYPSVLNLVESVATGIVSPSSNNDTPQRFIW